MPKPIPLGARARDIVTGFEGVVTSYHTYLSGCDRVTITPPVNAEGKLPDPSSFDISEVERLGGDDDIITPINHYEPEEPVEEPQEEGKSTAALLPSG